MRSLALLFVLAIPSLATATVPSAHKARAEAQDHPIRISLVNLNSHGRQIYLKTGLVDLPLGRRVDIDSHVGATLIIVSSTDLSLHEEIRITASDADHIISVR